MATDTTKQSAGERIERSNMVSAGFDMFMGAVQNDSELMQKGTHSLGAAAGGIFKERHFQAQLQEFSDVEAAEFKKEMIAAQEILLDEENPEAATQAVQAMSTAMNKLFTVSAKYKGNPYVQEQVSGLMNFNNKFLKTEFEAHFGEQANQIDAAYKQEQLSLKRQELDNAQALNQSKIEAEKARAEKYRSETNKTNRELTPDKNNPQNRFLTGPPGTFDVNMNEDQKTSAMFANASASIVSPLDANQKQATDIKLQDITKRMAQERLTKLVASNTIKRKSKKLGEPDVAWEMTAKDLEDVAATQIDPQSARNYLIYQSMIAEAPAHGVDPAFIDQKYAFLKDPSRVDPVAGFDKPLPERDALQAVIGADSAFQIYKTNAQGQKQTIEVNTFDDYRKNLPEDFREVPSGPIVESFKNATEIAQNMDEIDDVEKYKRLLREAAKADIDQIFGGGLPDNQINSGVRKNRVQAYRLRDAMIAKYAPQLSIQAGLTDAPARQIEEKKDEYENSSLLGKTLGVLGRLGTKTAEVPIDVPQETPPSLFRQRKKRLTLNTPPPQASYTQENYNSPSFGLEEKANISKDPTLPFIESKNTDPIFKAFITDRYGINADTRAGFKTNSSSVLKYDAAAYRRETGNQLDLDNPKQVEQFFKWIYEQNNIKVTGDEILNRRRK